MADPLPGERGAPAAAAPARPRVATIPLDADFGRTLARRLLGLYPEPIALARALLLLPNRRAARALTVAFVAESEGQALLLPRMIAFTDVGDADAAPGDDLDPALPPAMSPSERRFRLAAILMRGGAPAAAALADADALARALDTLTVHGRTPADLAHLDVSGLAHHWGKTLARLDAVARAWPAILAERGQIDPAARRVALAHALARRYAAEGSAHPVIAAGILNAPPFAVPLLHAVARLPFGQVVLPGLDQALPDAAWNTLDPADPVSAQHPQTALKSLLAALGVARAEVDAWEDAPSPGRARVAAAARALSPAPGPAAPAPIASTPEPAPAPAPAIPLVEAANPAEEAQAIALAVREALETPGETVALVTPDRALAARVRAHLARWRIEVDDSAGEPLAVTPPGAFARLLAAAAAGGFAAPAVLALAQHPFAGHADRAQHLVHTRALDLALRRAALPPPGLAHLARRVPSEAADWWRALAAVLAPLGGGARPLPVHVAALVTALSALGGDAVWTGPDGRALADTLDTLAEHGALLPDLGVADMAALLERVAADTPVRPPWGGHPRVRILGLLEARLQRFDLVILGGLNEGVWPAAPSPDPWLPPFARRRLGLPPGEAAIGLAAHDFLAALGAPRVLLTRARRDASAPASPSRFLLRLAAADPHALAPAHDLLAWARALDAPTDPPVPATRPAPVPPRAARPITISVTQVDTLRADPFAYYARAVLRLRPLDPLSADPTPARRGVFVHRLMERWFEESADPAELPGFAERLFARDWRDHPRLLALWRPRLVRAAEWAAARLAADAADGWRPLAVEKAGTVALAGGIVLTGRADRIDRGPDGALGIVDYKTGQPPSNAALAAGFASQLGLLATLATAGRLADVAAAPVHRTLYWRLSGGMTCPGECKDAVGKQRKDDPRPWPDATAFAADQWINLEAAVDRYLAGDAPFPARLHPEYVVGTDYDRLARLDEWQGRVE